MGASAEGRYRIIRKLGEGGVGEVFLVEDTHVGRKEALKVLKPIVACDPSFVVRFRREARAINRLQHPNIVGLHDCGRLPDGRYYLAMEYVDGEHLDETLRRVRRMPLARALPILAQLADATGHAHAHGVVHRDLKPSNMMLVEHRGHADVLKVLDFGLAKIIARDYSETIVATRRGEVVGTPAYLAPDQLRGTPPDPRQDVYSVGCIAHELVTGRPPFTGRTGELVTAHLTKIPEPPSVRAPDAGIPPELDAIVLRCLAKRPEERFADGRELGPALRPLVARLAAAPPADPPPLSVRGLADFTDEDTPIHWPAGQLVALGGGDPSVIASARTELLSATQSRELRQAALMALGEELLDLGVRDTRLIIGLAEIKELESELGRIASEATSIEARTGELEQTAREREASLSFAIGELTFDCEQAAGPQRSQLEGQIAELEGRLRKVAEGLELEMAKLAERGIELAIARDDAERALAEHYATVRAVVDEQVAAGEPHPRLVPLIERLRRA